MLMFLVPRKARPRGVDPRGRAGRTTAESYPHGDTARKSTTRFFPRAGGGCVTEAGGRKPRVSRVTGNFNQVARDLHRAIAAARFAPAHNLLVQQAQEGSYTRARMRGLPEPLPFKLNFSALARDVGFHRTHLNEQFHSLVTRRVFLPLGDGSYLINKDYREWLDEAGRPLLSPRAVGWCGEAPRGKAGRDALSGNPDTPLQPTRHPVAIDPTPPVGKNRHPLSGFPDTPLQSTRQVGLSPRTPVEERACGIESLRRVKKRGEEVFERETPPTNHGGPALREPDDLHALNEAVSLLDSDIRTDHVAMELGRQHNLPGMIAVPGWKFLRAARIFQGPGVSDKARRSWAYYFKIAAGVDDSERGKPLPWEAGAASPSRRRQESLLDDIRRKAAEARDRAGKEAPDGPR